MLFIYYCTSVDKRRKYVRISIDQYLLETDLDKVFKHEQPTEYISFKPCHETIYKGSER